MPNMNVWKPGEKIQAMVIGRSKSGKTWGAGSWPRPNIIDFDDGHATLGQAAWRAKYGNRSIEYEVFKEKAFSAKGVVTAHTAFDDACAYFDKWMKPDKRDSFDTWVVDSGTTLTQVALNKAIILLGSKQLSVTSQTQNKALLTGAVYPVIQDWGAERSLVEQFVRQVKDSGKHVLFLCHEMDKVDENGIVTSIVPMLTGQSRESIPLMFDELWFLRVQKKGPETVRYLQTAPDGIRQCGSRYGVPDGTLYDYEAVIKSLNPGVKLP